MLISVRKTKLWHGWRVALCWIFAIALSFTGLVFGRPDLKVSFTGTVVRESIRFVMQMPPMKSGGLFSKGAAYASKASKWKTPAGYTNERVSLSKSDLEILHKNGESHKNIIYQLHGGGYVIGFSDIYRNFAVRYSKLSNGADVVSLDYRIAPKNTYPAALNDALEGWAFLLAKGYKPENIIVVGDSAGGNLTLALVAKLRDEGKALPKAIICMSPWTDLAGKGASHTYNIYKDPMFGIKEGTAISEKFVPPAYAGKTDLQDKYLSPVYGSFSGFPPMLLQVGTYEVLESDSLTVYKKAKAAGDDVKITEYKGMFHVFQMAGYLMPESKAAWVEVSDFLMKQFNN
ncbi:MAG: alpha/beta hydrolase [Eubacteriales bacterium]